MNDSGRPDPEDRSADPAWPIADSSGPPVPSGPSAPLRGAEHPLLPRLPSGVADAPAIASRPTGPPLIPPLETTSPPDLVESVAVLEVLADGPAAPRVTAEEFSPLRSEPPPSLLPTWLLRSAVFVLLLVAVVVTIATEYTGAIDDIRSSPLVIGAHALAFAMLLVWSFLAMRNADRLIPATRYQKRSRGSFAVVLWVVAAAGPVLVVVTSRRLDDRLDDTEDIQALIILLGSVVLSFVLVWLPFRYHSRQATRIGAPYRPLLMWFIAPALAAIGGLTILSLGLRADLATDGLTAGERSIQVMVAYGLPMLVFAMSTWRSVTVFDEVIDLRWRRWRTDWEQTMEDLGGLPAPGPEDSPDIGDLTSS